ncbi:PAS domain-containing sensor histidine kinase [Methanoregula sp.]|uniref:PAS domain-containing sensor histidine kinase n=1 Tax=Methanoregula sp. TaxID=2052170 RepID=UPI00236DC363|nr:PAS domain-containing sensor histidine kinase [Methanoregula sp.]MDD1687463.1 PAS domain S-box protein [Methanoregula sp.]
MISPIITRLREHPRATQFLIFLTFVIALAANLYGLAAGISIIFPHLFYIPIILAAFFYPRWGVPAAVTLCALYLLMVAGVQAGTGPDLLPAAARCVVYLIVAVVVTWLSGRVDAQKNELVTAKEEWENTFNAVPDLIALIGKEHNIIRVNKAMADTLGITPETAVGLKCYEVVHHTTSHPPFCPHALLMKDGQEHSAEVHEDTLGGDFLVTTNPLYDPGGNLIGSVHVARDISKRKKAERELRESEQKYRSLVETSFDGIAIHQKGILVYVNQTAARILGSEDPSLFLGRSALDMVAPAFRERTAERVQQAPDKALELVREQFLKLDGTPIDVDVTTVPSIWEGRPAAYVTFRDITARVQAEAALRESEERYRTILENLQDVYFRFDQDSRLVMMSPSAARTFGCNTVSEILGSPATSLWKNPEERSQMIEAMKRQGGSVQDWEAEFVKRDGTPFWVSVTARLHTNPAGEFQGSEGIIRDISGRKKTDETLKTALNKLNMLSSITRHDILNQIMGLRTFLELSKEDLKGTKYEAFIDKEEQAAEAIQRQIEFTKYYQDIGVNAPKWQEAGLVIREAKTQLNTRSIDVQVAVPGVEIFADPLIVKVFFNLMENSLRHGERVTTMSFSSLESDAGLVITYRDNGVGISTDEKTKLFRKGFGKNTGLGLFLSREILAITGITITENGMPGEGVQFEIIVPEEGYRFTTGKKRSSDQR